MANSPGNLVEFDTKAIAEDGTFTGYASVFGVKDAVVTSSCQAPSRSR